ncbi:unnamed protein product [Arctia plantaginis]|uniref:Bro-N domain-containing protein n=1 Tax=Arctia plantaginis TaxID=874455 RepID=A0A8S0YZN4_ARCPL|nr:unnamed protein product [Arctia plantaginis]
MLKKLIELFQMNGEVHGTSLGLFTVYLEIPPNSHPETLFVSESGIYALLAHSNKSKAQKLMRFVYEERVQPCLQAGRPTENIPNGVNLLNRTKELLLRDSYKSCYNNIRTNIDVPSAVKDLLSIIYVYSE